jgi:hypothetical protein
MNLETIVAITGLGVMVLNLALVGMYRIGRIATQIERAERDIALQRDTINRIYDKIDSLGAELREDINGLHCAVRNGSKP